MRQVLSSASAIAAAASVAWLIPASAAVAQTSAGYSPYYQSQNYSYGLNLPSAPLPSGNDEIRAADGTTCKSSIATSGAYLDVGGIGSQGIDGRFDSGSVYGRVLIPLGETPGRLDCTSLYKLEIERLRGELQLVQMGLGGGGAAPAVASAKGGATKAWQDEGWSNSGWKQPMKAGTAEEKPKAVISIPAVESRAAKPASGFKIGAWETSVMRAVE